MQSKMIHLCRNSQIIPDTALIVVKNASKIRSRDNVLMNVKFLHGASREIRNTSVGLSSNL